MDIFVNFIVNLFFSIEDMCVILGKFMYVY